MRLRRLGVEGFKCFRRRVEIEFPEQGSLVLTGANGAGKSTLLDAAVRGLVDNHGAGGKEAKKMRPWGADLTPRVMVEFEHGGDVYRVSKQFLDRPSSQLEKSTGGGGFEPVAEGKAADQRVREMLRMETPHGLAGPEECGLARVLWCPQGSLEMGDLSGRLLDDIREMLGAELAGPEGNAIEARINEQYARDFTPKTAEPRKGLLHQLQVELSETREELSKARSLTDQIEGYDVSLAMARERLVSLMKELGGLRGELAKAESEEREHKALSEKQQALRTQTDLAEAKYGLVRGHIERIAALTKDRAVLEPLVRELEEKLQARTRSEQAAEEELKEKAASQEGAKAPDPELERLEQRAELAREWNEIEERLAALRGRIGRIGELESRLRDQERGLRSLNAPSGEQMQEIRSADKSMREAAIRLNSSLVRLRIMPESEQRIDVVEGEPAGEQAVGAGGTFEIRGEGRVSVRVAGFGAIQASGPEVELEDIKRELAEARERLERLAGPFGTRDTAELERRHRERLVAEAAAGRTETEVKAVLGGDTVEGLREMETSLAGRRASILKTEPGWEETAPEAAGLEEQAREARRQKEARMTEAEQRLQEARETRHGAQLERAKAEQELKSTREKLEKARGELGLLETDGKSPEERGAELTRRQLEWESASGRLKEVEEKLAALPAEAAQRAEGLRQRAAEVEQGEREARTAIRDAETSKRALMPQSPHQRLAQAEERVRELEERLAGEKQRLDAVKLLRDTLAECKQEALAGLVEPVAEEATRLLERIAGGGLARIEVDDNLGIREIRPEAASGAVAVQEMSGGEQEQIRLAMRLALAKLLSREERQLLVLDDVLLNTDDGRLARIFEILGELEDKLQLLILTCHPERYRQVPRATFRRLEGGETREPKE